MNTFNKIALLIIALIYFNSCLNKNSSDNQKKFPVIMHLNLSEAISDPMPLSEIAYKIEYIPLQTSDSCMLDSDVFNNLVVSGEYFFIKNGFNVAKFDHNGNFRNLILKLGRGPEEAIARLFAINEKGKVIYILDNITDKVKTYTFDGRFINKINEPINSPQHRTSFIAYFNSNLFVATSQNPRHKYLYSCFDLKNNSIKVICKNIRKYEKSQLDKRPLTPFDYNIQITDSTVFFKEWFSDTIMTMDKNYFIKPKYIIDLSTDKLEWETWRDHGMFNIASGPPGGYWVQAFLETNSFFFMTLMSFKEPQLFVSYNKKNGKIKIYKRKEYRRISEKVYLKNDLDYITDFALMNGNGYFLYYDNCLFSVIEAKDFIDSFKRTYDSKLQKNALEKIKLDQLFKEVTEMSNPVIIKVYLK
jgi:hypothetical protein